MDEVIQTVLDEYHRRAQAETALMKALPFEDLEKRLDEFLLPIGPATGQVLNILIKEARCKTIVEIGTSYGYSTIWLAEAARFLPYTGLIATVRGIAIQGRPLTDFGPELLVGAAWMALLFLAAVRAYRFAR